MHFLKRSLPPNQQFLTFGLRALRLIGLWGPDRRQIFRYYLLVLAELVLLVGPKIIFGSGQDGFESFVRNSAELIFLIEVMISIGIFASRRRSFERLVEVLDQTLQRKWPDSLREEIGQFNRKVELFARVYAAYLFGMLVFFCVFPVISTFYKVVFVAEEERSDFLLIIYVKFFGLDIERNVHHYMIYILSMICPISASAYQSSIKMIVIVVVIQYGAKLFDLVAKRVTVLELIKSDQERHDELREIIKLHNLALEYVEHLEETVCFIMINQILSCMLISCLMMFYITTNFGPNVATVVQLFMVLVGEMIVYCFNGTMLIEKATSVVDALFYYPWYKEPIWVQKVFLRMIQRGQRPTGITAAKFYYVDVNRLGVVFQASYSYYLILKNSF
ncbi:olfactory receptor [Culex quinquefasciatus]|uniref:Odorant receptor n=1 Tax=Culex quinquefasciatus TaxID=7176 RepID=B0WYQ8_CULQU|nr:olfactory receptor [Culex quinquefasciatus]|eukprot:XP_001862530.1 olfactory receptor [Culex quinquefasciatus]